MNKLTLAVLVSIASVAASARSVSLSYEDDHPIFPVGIALAAPLQVPFSNYNIYGLRLNALYTESFETIGLDAGLVGYNRDKVIGLQAQGAVAWVDGNMTGLQMGGIANVVCGNAVGLQLGSILNYTRGDFAGMQISAINHNGTFYGFQVGGFNYDKGVCWGLQVGVANSDINEYRGWSVGAVNYAERLNGFQLGGVNILAGSGRGVQLGVFNAAAKFSGIQIGVLNIIENGELPIMPVLNAQF